jgi:glycosyltransferase involved in cell wall biosynthesis
MALACRSTHTPWLINMHSPYLKRSRYVLGMHLAERIVAVAAAIAKPLLSDGMEKDRIAVIHNGFDEAALLTGDAKDLRAQLHIPEDATVAAIAGSLIRRKGHDILFAAMRQMPDAKLHVLAIGDGPERAAFEKDAAGLPVHFLGRRADIGPILRDAADFLVAPSRQEAFGRVIIEAAFAGLPAIGAAVDGIPEAIQAGVTGLLVPPESPPALAEAMSHLMADRNLRRQLGQAAQARARRDFTIDHCAAQMTYEYRRLRDMPPPRLADRSRPYLNLLLGRRDHVAP